MESANVKDVPPQKPPGDKLVAALFFQPITQVLEPTNPCCDAIMNNRLNGFPVTWLHPLHEDKPSQNMQTLTDSGKNYIQLNIMLLPGQFSPG